MATVGVNGLMTVDSGVESCLHVDSYPDSTDAWSTDAVVMLLNWPTASECLSSGRTGSRKC